MKQELRVSAPGSCSSQQMPSINVSGKIKEQQFILKNEHGIFTLLKERVAGCTPQVVSELTEVPVADIEKLDVWFIGRHHWLTTSVC